MKSYFRISSILILIFATIISFQNFTIVNTETDFDEGTAKFDIDVDYGSLSKVIKDTSNRVLPDPRSKECKNRSTKEYQCGELPYGKILNKHTKRLDFNIPIKRMNQKDGDSRYYTKKRGVIPLFLNRHQTGGSTKLASLDNLKKQKISTSKRIGDNLFLRLSPNKETMKMALCTNIPGFHVFSKEHKIRIFLEQKVTLVTLKSEAIVGLDIGSLKVDSSRVCADVIADTKDGYFQNIRIVKIHPPTYKNLRHSGLKIKVHTKLEGWFLNLIADVVKVFGFDIRNLISNMVRAEIKKQVKSNVAVTKADVTSGKWLKKYMEKVAIEKQANIRLKKLTDELNKRDWYQEALEERIDMICDNLLSNASLKDLHPLLIRPLKERCNNSAKVKVKLFFQAENKQCYKYFFEPKKAKDQWWTDECNIRTKVALSVDKEDHSVMTCISDTSRILRDKFSVLTLPKSCRTLIEDY